MNVNPGLGIRSEANLRQAPVNPGLGQLSFLTFWKGAQKVGNMTFWAPLLFVILLQGTRLKKRNMQPLKNMLNLTVNL